jgi:putative transposase
MEANMPQSLSMIIVHIVFSTKDRFPYLNPTIRSHLYAYLATVACNSNCETYRVGGTGDHMHFALRLARTIAIADLVEELKISSSRWLKTQQPELRRFSWQRGYGAFSISQNELDALVAYIGSQQEHHGVKTFQEEYLTLLKKHGVQCDERYLWD